MKYIEDFDDSELAAYQPHPRMTLHNALRAGRFQQFRYHVKMGANPNQQDQDGLTPLMKCCYVKTPKTAIRLCSLLLKFNADKSLQDSRQMTSLHHAARGHNVAVLRLLINDSDHYDLNQEDEFKNTVLHYACASGKLEAVETILKQMVRYHLGVNLRNNVGFTPLHTSCQFGHLDIARVLVQKGNASLTVKDGLLFKTPREWLQIHYEIPDDVNPFDLGTLIQRKLPSEIDIDLQELCRRPHTAPVDCNKRKSRARARQPQTGAKRPITAPPRHWNTETSSQLPSIPPRDIGAKTGWETLRLMYERYEPQMTPSYRKHVVVTWPKPEPPKVNTEEENPRSARALKSLLSRMKKGSRGDASGESDSSRNNSPSPDKARSRLRWSAGKFTPRKIASAPSMVDGGSPARGGTPDEQKAAEILARAMKRPKAKSVGSGLSSLLLKAAKKQDLSDSAAPGERSSRPTTKTSQKSEEHETPRSASAGATTNSLSLKLLLKASKSKEMNNASDANHHADTPIP